VVGHLATGSGCDFLVRSEKEDEVVGLLTDHACRIHNVCEITPGLEGKMQGSTKSIWWEEEGHKCTKH
jgi:predicted small metal-binding protein